MVFKPPHPTPTHLPTNPVFRDLPHQGTPSSLAMYTFHNQKYLHTKKKAVVKTQHLMSRSRLIGPLKINPSVTSTVYTAMYFFHTKNYPRKTWEEKYARKNKAKLLYKLCIATGFVNRFKQYFAFW